MRVYAKKIGPSLSWIRCIRQQKALYGWDTWSGRILWLRQLVSVSARGEQQHTEVVIFDGAQVCPVYIIHVKCSAPNHWVIQDSIVLRISNKRKEDTDTPWCKVMILDEKPMKKNAAATSVFYI